MASFLIKDVRIFDGKKTIDHGSVLVESGKIAKVSSSDIQYDGMTISKPGHTLLPGLIDVHNHVNGGNTVALPQALRFGVTTVCDMGNRWDNIQKLFKQRESGDCADLKTTSYAATIEMGWPIPVILKHSDTPETREEISTYPKLKTAKDGRKYVQDRLKEGVDYIKLMHESGTVMGLDGINKPSIELQEAVIDEAHKHGLIVVAHATCLEDTVEILEAGVDGLTHTLCDRPPNQRLIDAYKKNNAHCNPTLAALGSLTTEGKAIQEKFAHDPRVQHLLDSDIRDRMCLCMSMAKERGSQEHAFESVRQLKKAGIAILVGSDSAGPAVGTAWGLSAHHEMYLLVEKCDFTPGEALRAATSLAAERLRFPDRGLIKEGLRADLLLVEGNPLDDIDATLNLRGVWTEGQLCSAYKSVL